MSADQLKLLLIQRQKQRQQQQTAFPPPPYTARPLTQSNTGMSRPNTNLNSMSQLTGPPATHSRLTNPGGIPTMLSPVQPISHPSTMAPTITTLVVEDNEDDDDSPIVGGYDSPFSNITISINAPVRIDGDNNHLTFDPCSAASMFGNSLFQSLRTASVTGSGIPLIDEDGRPRPIHVNVVAGTEVRGSGNAIGTGAIPGLGGLGVSGGPSVRGTEDMGKASTEALLVRTREAMRTAELNGTANRKIGLPRGREEDADRASMEALLMRTREAMRTAELNGTANRKIGLPRGREEGADRASMEALLVRREAIRTAELNGTANGMIGLKRGREEEEESEEDSEDGEGPGERGRKMSRVE